MYKRPKILITNDDGILAPGLRSLANALIPIGDLYIVAPSGEQSGKGLSITLHSPLSIKQIPWEGTAHAWHVTGTPADCIRLALSVLLDFTPDLIVSGINIGSNAGRTVHYSGTVGAAIEGCLRSIPSIAFSCTEIINPDYQKAEPLVASIVNHYLEHPLPSGTLLNVNFPDTPHCKGVRLAKQGKSFWKEDPEERKHPEGHSYYWLGGKWHDIEEDEMSDVFLLQQGYATAVPIHVGEMTDFAYLESHGPIFNEKMKLSDSLSTL